MSYSSELKDETKMWEAFQAAMSRDQSKVQTAELKSIKLSARLKLAAAILIGMEVFSGCSLGQDEPTGPKECFIVTLPVGGLGETIRDSLRQRGLDPTEMDGVIDTVDAVGDTLDDQHKKYDYLIPGDKFELCIAGDMVSPGSYFSVVDK